MMKIFLTGGTGFLGTQLLKRFLKDGHSVTALATSEKSEQRLKEQGVGTVRGTLNNIADWEDALKNHDVLVHAAAPIDVWGKWEMFYQDITVASKKLFDACDTYGVKRFVFLSSESVLQDKDPLLDIDETHPYPKTPNSYYGKAKKLAEQALLRTESKTTCIILRPPFLWGKGNKGLETIAEKVKKNQFIWVDHGQAIMETAHVQNVVEAISLALTKGKNKEIYYVTDDNPMTVKEFLIPILKAKKVAIPHANLSGNIARPLAVFVEKLWRTLHLPGIPPLSRFQLDLVALPRRYKIDKIKRDLGYRPIYSFEKGVGEL